MDNIAIQARGLSKQFRIGQRDSAGYQTLRDTLAGAFQISPRRRRLRSSMTDQAILWTLRDVTFDIHQGQVVGLIGRNGAGKTTLLKILSRITEPTAGTVDLYGRVGSLLEVGTGFHPELTGRENIFLNGAILGMKRVEIERNFDAIIAFAETERFLDTPVKHYSTGMAVRLAFAVAAHLEPEILLVDEVLAVGDVAFQKKCLGKMESVAKTGRTVVFVSHNMGQIKRLCNHGIWLDNGQVAADGPIEHVTARYLASLTKNAQNRESEPLSGFLGWRLVNAAAGMEHTLLSDQDVTLEVPFNLQTPLKNAHLGLVLRSVEGENISGWGKFGLSLKAGRHKFVYHIPYLPLRSGIYRWYASLWDGAIRIDTGDLVPDLVVTTEEHSMLDYRWAGLLNVPCQMELFSEEEGQADANTPVE